MCGPTELAKWIKEEFAGIEFSTTEALEKLRSSGLVTEKEADELETGHDGLPTGKRKLDHTFHTAIQIAKKKGWIKRAGQYGRWYAYGRGGNIPLPIQTSPTQPSDKVRRAKDLLDLKKSLGGTFGDLTDEEIDELLTDTRLRAMTAKG
jgi:hypothetical protein